MALSGTKSRSWPCPTRSSVRVSTSSQGWYHQRAAPVNSSARAAVVRRIRDFLARFEDAIGMYGEIAGDYKSVGIGREVFVTSGNPAGDQFVLDSIDEIRVGQRRFIAYACPPHETTHLFRSPPGSSLLGVGSRSRVRRSFSRTKDRGSAERGVSRSGASGGCRGQWPGRKDAEKHWLRQRSNHLRGRACPD